jgi:hypothetical protein
VAVGRRFALSVESRVRAQRQCFVVDVVTNISENISYQSVKGFNFHLEKNKKKKKKKQK